jgi:hypothetical protein
VKGRDVHGNEIDLTPEQEDFVRRVRAWALCRALLILPYRGRGSGKSTLLATVAEYDKRGWPEDL